MTELRATYRLQLTAEQGFAHARSLLPYLRDLGISHLYLSPSLQARPGSTHGYDVIDPTRLSDALGGPREFEALAADADGAGMGIVLDVVPNHMAVSDSNPYWADPKLRVRFFDIDPATGRHRRFFDIGDLAGVRQEDPAVFEETHELVLALVRDGLIDGLRIDHPDGLADPLTYLERLRSVGVPRVWVEKILDPSEQLRDWPVCGTVGYEFACDVTALFIDPAGEAPLSELWHQVSGDRRPFGEVAREAKLEQLRGPFRPDVERLARLAPGIDLGRLEQALASLPVYRTYVQPDASRVAPEDRGVIAASGMSEEIARMLLLERAVEPEFVTRFQQTTPAVMAKGVEDTAFYRYGRLLALNDVGGDPSRFGIGVGRFHEGCLLRAERFPLNLLCTQTHDAKRSPDVRARIGALAAIAEQWRAHVERWLSITEPLVHDGAPDDVERYFLFQTLVGAWPISADRLTAYMRKAMREAKRTTNWISPDTEREDAVARFCEELVDHAQFMSSFTPFAEEVALAGERAALGQLVLKLTVPGIPDVYQGDELPLLALVDPDNRRPVDWQWHRAMLARLMGGSRPDRETLKLWVTLRLLTLRARRPAPLLEGNYEPLAAGEHTCALLRGGEILVVVALRGEPQGTLEAPGGRWRDVLRGGVRTFNRAEPLAKVVDSSGVGVWERD